MNRFELIRFFGRLHHVRLTGCWVWLGAFDGAGYPALVHDEGTGAHVYAHREFVGLVPDGYHVDHLCMNPRCVNPAHLEAVTPEENARRYRDVVKLCKRGHPQTPENVRRWKNNNKAGYCNYCVACRRERRTA